MKSFLRSSLFIGLTCFSLSTHAWNALGHMVVAQIAYQHVNQNVQKQIDKLINTFHQEYPEIDSYLLAATWPDAIRGQKIETYTHWHYINYAISTDNTPLKSLFDTDNAEWAIAAMEPVVKNNKANPYERVRFLAFLTHIVGDLHQPLHTTSNITLKNPDGDRGGNLFYVYDNKDRVTLHRLWDGGVGLFEGESTPNQAITIATRFQQNYPESFFGDKVKNLNPSDWAKEGVNFAKKNVYETREEQPIANSYIEINNPIIEQQVTLAGYRLAKLLNSLF